MPKVLYFTSWYDEKNEQRRSELRLCLDNLLANKEIDKVFLVCENCSAPIANPKLVPIFTTERPTYSNFFELMNDSSSFGDVVVLANTDVYPDEESVAKLRLIKDDECYALSRWEGNKLWDRKDSQDVWVFKNPMLGISAQFCLGIAGCDNRIAKVIVDAGYKISNPSKSIKFFHVHISQIRNYDPHAAIPGPYEFVVPTELPKDYLFKNVLHVGFPVPPLELAFKQNSENYKFIGWVPYQKRLNELHTLMLVEVSVKKYDLIFLQIQGPGILSTQLIKEIRRRSPGSIIVNWSGDVRAPQPPWYTEIGKLIDLTCFSNQTDVDIIRSNGVNAAYLQVGFDDKIYTPGLPQKKWPDIVFMGNNYKTAFPLSPFRDQMVTFLKGKYNGQFGVYGAGWDSSSLNLMNAPHDEADCYKACKIGINLSHFDYKRFSSDRIFRIMGSGAFCLTKTYPDMDLEFKLGEHLDVWSTFAELEEKIIYYLNNPAERVRMAKNACDLVHTKHTWKNRLEELKSLL